jgi:hypothetical protein
MNLHFREKSDKRQIRPLVREGAPQRKNSNSQTESNIWSWAPDGARHQDRLTDRQSQYDFDFDRRVRSYICQGSHLDVPPSVDM